MARISTALAFAIVATAVTVAFTGVQLACGYRETSAESVAPGEAPPPQTSHCVGFLHPMMPPMLLACGLVLAAILRGGGRDTGAWVGGALALVTFSWFSLGHLGTVVGLLLLVAGLRVSRDARRVEPAAPISLALVGLATTLCLWLLPDGPGWHFAARPVPLVVLSGALAVVALLLVRRAWADVVATLVGLAAFGSELARFLRDPGSFAGDPFSAAFVLAAGVAALIARRRRAG